MPHVLNSRFRKKLWEGMRKLKGWGNVVRFESGEANKGNKHVQEEIMGWEDVVRKMWSSLN